MPTSAKWLWHVGERGRMAGVSLRFLLVYLFKAYKLTIILITVITTIIITSLTMYYLYHYY